MSQSLLRQLIQEIKFSNKRGESLQWKFDPMMLRKGPNNWFRIWSGVEKIGGFWFAINVNVARGMGDDYRIYATHLVSGHIRDERIFEELTVRVNDPVSEDDIKRLRSAGEKLRKQILDHLERDDSYNVVARLDDREQFYNSLPPWRPGRWRVPATETGHADIIVGDRLDMGHFQFVASLHPIVATSSKPKHALILVCRKDFALEGPREAWLYSVFRTFDEAKREAEIFIDFESKRLDVENDLEGVREELYHNLMTNGQVSRW